MITLKNSCCPQWLYGPNVIIRDARQHRTRLPRQAVGSGHTGCSRLSRPGSRRRGWTSVIRTGRKGQCDWRAVRRNGHIEYLEVEIKATGKNPSKEQMEYLALRKHQGIPVTWADSLEMFQKWYSETTK